MSKDHPKIGKSRYVLGVLTGFILGLFFADKINLDLWWLLGISLGLIIALFIFWSDELWRLIIFIIIFLILGLGYYQSWLWRENKKILKYNQEITFEAPISSDQAILSDKQTFYLKYQKTKILVNAERFPEFHYGDKLKFTATIQDPHKIKTKDNFNYGQYLLKSGIRGIINKPQKIEKIGEGGNPIYKGIYFISNKFEKMLGRLLPEPDASLQIGLILGAKKTLPDSLMSAFNRTGTTHIVAVSGFNVMVIVSALTILLGRYSRKLAFWGAIGAIFVFVIMTGAVASVLRAGILAGLIAWGKSLGRRPYYPILILLVASLMLLVNPAALKNDVSFQLSFLAFIGLVFISPKISEWKFLIKIPALIKVPFSETMGAQIMVLPILLYQFGILSLVAPLTNILILPIVPYAMLAGFIMAISGFIWFGLGKIIALIGEILLKYIIIIVEYFSKIPWSALTLKASFWWWIPIYYLLIYIFFGKKQREQFK